MSELPSGLTDKGTVYRSATKDHQTFRDFMLEMDKEHPVIQTDRLSQIESTVKKGEQVIVLNQQWNSINKNVICLVTTPTTNNITTKVFTSPSNSKTSGRYYIIGSQSERKKKA